MRGGLGAGAATWIIATARGSAASPSPLPRSRTSLTCTLGPPPAPRHRTRTARSVLQPCQMRNPELLRPPAPARQHDTPGVARTIPGMTGMAWTVRGWLGYSCAPPYRGLPPTASLPALASPPGRSRNPRVQASAISNRLLKMPCRSAASKHRFALLGRHERLSRPASRHDILLIVRCGPVGLFQQRAKRNTRSWRCFPNTSVND